MKKITLIIAAMFTMAQINAAAEEVANAEAYNAESATQVVPDDDDTKSSAYNVSHPFEDEEESTTHWTIESNGFYFGMGVKHSWDLINNSFEIGVLNLAAVNYNSLHGQNISLGVGIHHKSYSMKRPNLLVRGVNDQVVTVSSYPSQDVDKIKDRSSNLNLWSVQFPLIFSQNIYKSLKLHVAGIMKWNTYARVDNHYEMDKVEYDTKFKDLKQNKLNFDFMGGLTVKSIGVYCRYSPGEIFKEGYGPEIKNTWSLGLIMFM